MNSERLVWVDVSRAICLVAVVAYHIYIWHYSNLNLAPNLFAGEFWGRVNSILGALRMPLLLILSGMLASGKVAKGFKSGTAVITLATNYYIYIVWLVIYATVGVILGDMTGQFQLAGDIPIFAQIVIPDTTLWFIYALAIYIPLFVILRPLPPALVLGVLGAATVFMSMALEGNEPLWQKVIRLAFYFATGLYCKVYLFEMANRRSAKLTLIGIFAVAVLTLASSLVESRFLGETLYVARALAFSGALIGLVALGVRFNIVGGAMSLLGQHTLSIYVMHPLIIAAIVMLATGPLETVSSMVIDSSILALVYPILLTIFVLGACLFGEYILRLVGLHFLFSMPRPLKFRHAARPNV